MKGIYVLALRLNRDIDLTVGKLGQIHFKKGYYYYIGSALGAGGFKRVIRHFNVASGKNITRKWHIDYFLPHSEVICAVCLPTDEVLECKASGSLMEFLEFIKGFGCSDCKCKTHLYFSKEDNNNNKKNIINAMNKLTGNESTIIYPNM